MIKTFSLRFIAYAVLISLFSFESLFAFVSSEDLESRFRGFYYLENDKRIEEESKILKEEDLKKLHPDELKELATILVKVAIHDETKASTYNYALVQKVISDKAEKFSKTYVQVVSQNPQLDSTVNFPMSQAGRNIYKNNVENKKKEIFAKIKENYGIFYYYRGNCSYCRKFSPVLKALANKYSLDVLAITKDGLIDPEFPKSRLDDQSVWNNIKSHLDPSGNNEQMFNGTPLLIAINYKTRKPLYLSAGFRSLDEIENIVLMLLGDEEEGL